MTTNFAIPLFAYAAFFTTIEGVFIRPAGHTLPDGLQSLSGSDANGGCIMQCVINGQCGCPEGVLINSTLMDGVCPTSVDNSDPNYARDFFTISRSGDNSVVIGFRWADRFVLRGVELKLINCEIVFTGVHTINVWRSTIYPTFSTSALTLVGSYVTNPNDLSCNDVTTIVIPTDTTSSSRNYFIEFAFPPGDSNTGVYIAEAQFSDSIIMVPEVISSSPSLPGLSSTPRPTPAVSSTPQQSTAAVSSTPSTKTLNPSTHTIAVSSITSTSLDTRTLYSSSLTMIPGLLLTPLPTPLGLPSTVPPTHTMPSTTKSLTIFNSPSPTQPGLPDNQGVVLSTVVGTLLSVIAIFALSTVIITILWCRQKIKTREFIPERHDDFTLDTGSRSDILLKENPAYGNVDRGETVDTDTNPAYSNAHPPPSRQSAEYDYIPDTLHGNLAAGNRGTDSEDNNGRLASVLYEEMLY